MIAGTLEIQLMANMARLADDMRQAKQHVSEATEAMNKAVETTKHALEALGIGLGAVEFKEFVMHAIEAADELGKLSQKIGMSVEDLGAYRLVAAQSGLTMEGFAQGVKKLSTYMTDHNDKLKAAGITATGTNEAMLQLADLFHDMPDGALKTATAVTLFGRAGIDLIPMLNKGSEGMQEMIEKGKALSAITAESAKQAEEFVDKLKEAQAYSTAFAQTLAAKMLPTLQAVIDAWVEYQQQSNGAATATDAIAEVFKTIVVLGANVVYVFKEIGVEVGGMAAQMAAIARGDFAGAASIGVQMQKDADVARAAIDKFSESVMHGAEKEAEAKKVVTAAEQEAAAKRAAALRDSTKSQDDAKSSYDGLVKSILEKIAAEEAERANGGKLTEDQKLKAELSEKLRYLSDRLNASQKKYLQTLIDQVVALKQHNLEEERFAKLAAEANNRQVDGIDALDKETQKIVEETEKIREHNTELTLGKNAAELMKIARLDDAIAAQQHLLAIADDIDGESAWSKAIRDNISALQDQKNAMGETITANNLRAQAEEWKRFTDDIERALTDSLMAGFANGKSAGQNFIDSLKHMLETAALKIVVQALVQPVMGAVGGAMGIAGAAGTTGNLLSGASGANTLFGGGSGLYTSFASSSLGQSLGLWGTVDSATFAGAGGAAMGLDASVAGMTSLGAAVPYIGAALAIGGALGLFGGSDRTASLQAQGIKGTFGPSGFAGNIQNLMGSSPTDLWGGDSPSNFDAATLQQINAQIAGLYATVGRIGASAGLDVSGLSSVSYTTPGGTVKGVANELNAAMAALSDALVTKVMPNVTSLQQSGESLLQTFERITQQRISWQEQLDVAAGKITQQELDRQHQLAAVSDDVTKALMREVWAQQDAAAAATVAATVAATAAKATADAAAATAKTYQDAMNAAQSNLISSYQSEIGAKQAIVSTMTGYVSALHAYSASLSMGTQSVLSPTGKYDAAKAIFEDVSRRARLGDQAAIGKLQQASADFLTASQATSNSALQYATDYAAVQSALSATADLAQRQADIAQQQVMYDQQQVDLLQQVNNSTLTVTDAIVALQQAIIDAVAHGITPTTSAGTYHSGAGATYNTATDAWTNAQGTGSMNTAQLASTLTGIYQQYGGVNGGGDAVLQAARNVGLSLSDVDRVTGLSAGTAEAYAAAHGIASFDVGTDYVPKTGIALIHQGERVMTAGDNASLADEIRALRADMQALRVGVEQTAAATAGTERFLRMSSPDGQSIRTHAA